MKRKYSNDYGSRKRPRLLQATSSVSPTSTDSSYFADILVDSQMAGTAAGYAGLAFGGPAVGDVASAIGTFGGALYGGLKVFGSSSQKNMGKGNNRATNALIGKTAVSISGKAKVKRVKPVKVSPYLKKAVKQVMQGSSASGLYRRNFSGMIGQIYNNTVGGADATLTATIFNVGGVASCVLPGTSKACWQKTWFNSLCLSNFSGNTVTIDHADLNFFTPFKIWHAASVLFNNKADGVNPYATTTNNLSANFIQNTGVPAPTSGNLKINVKSSNVLMTMRNMSARTVTVDIYECVSTVKFQNEGPVAEALSLAQTIQDGTDPGDQQAIVSYYQGATKLDNIGTSFLTEGTIDAMSILKSNGLKWKYKKHSMVMGPGEMCTHTVVGPSGILDFQKLYDPSTGTYNTICAYKDWSKHLMISVRTDFGLRAGGATNEGRRLPRLDTTYPSLLSSSIAVECSESFSITVPEIAGFVGQTAAVGAGVGQPLNMRRNKIHIMNVNQGTGNTGITPVYTNEENPIGLASGELL